MQLSVPKHQIYTAQSPTDTFKPFKV